MAKHTPGPWSADAEGEIAFCVEGMVEGHPEIVCEVLFQVNGMDREMGAANAQLIAAAPDLLESLQELLSRVDLVLYRRYVGGDLIDKCRAAIQKAVI